jgi:hypothetical protein
VRQDPFFSSLILLLPPVFVWHRVPLGLGVRLLREQARRPLGSDLRCLLQPRVRGQEDRPAQIRFGRRLWDFQLVKLLAMLQRSDFSASQWQPPASFF